MDKASLRERSSGLDTPIQYVKGVGPYRAVIFERMKIRTVRDLLLYFPFRYESWDAVVPIRSLRRGGPATITGILSSCRTRRTRNGRENVTATISDESGAIEAVWFNQPHLMERLHDGRYYRFQGEIGFYRGMQIKNPRFEMLEQDAAPQAAGLVPVYQVSDKLYLGTMRRIVAGALARYAGAFVDPLPPDILHKRGLMPYVRAVRQCHFPDDGRQCGEALRRLSYDDFFFMELALALRRRRRTVDRRGIRFVLSPRLRERIWRRFPFSFTKAQAKAVEEIFGDMQSDRPMNRLVQGDVGSGKTAVALCAMLAAVGNGFQTVLMAPTEILAAQHYRNLLRYLHGGRVNMGLLVSGLAKSHRDDLIRRAKSGAIDIIVGTHAVIQQDVVFAKLGVVVVDEQHKFGVLQRSLLMDKAKVTPDVLVMTATPIPRTLALTLFGDLDVSVVDELPPGRRPVTTRWVREEHREQAYELVRAQLDQGRQAFVIYPLVDASEHLDLKAATEMARRLSDGPFQEYRVALLHGRMSNDKKQGIMDDFLARHTQVLVATVVVEVGVDIPNASVMMIEDAHRFGLAQLHQLRGRIGRGPHESTCLVFGRPTSDYGAKRLRLFASIDDGFKLAEEDLKLRGPGEFFGIKQHGLPELRVGNPIEDVALLEEARRDAFAWLRQHPEFDVDGQGDLQSALRERFRHGLDLIHVG